ncbi:MAG: dTMP kinase [Deltaproteobacteria bacterium]|nr:dTMP kinase [Deltaproteobacteria bacterium]
MGVAKPGRLEKGVLVALEGIDGTGKSTQARNLAAGLEAAGWPVASTREPTEGEWGKRIRRLARQGRRDVPPEDELDWFLRDRMEDVERTIRPALNAGKIVVTDRYYFSTMAYQGALGLDPVRIREMNEALFPRPDLVLLLRIDPATSLERIARGRPEGVEASYESTEYLTRVAALFDSFDDPAIRRLDASGTPAEVEARIWYSVQAYLDEHAR